MNFLASYKSEIDQGIENFFNTYPCDNFSDSEQKLFDGCKYAVMQGGKRIRPVLGLMVWERMSNELTRDEVISCLISLELMHASSLVHDDLPAMDNDTLRRGQPTVWKEYGEVEAILIGDMLIAMAFENLANASPDFCIKNLIKTLSHLSGNNGMIGGQMRDIDSENQLEISIEALETLHSKKTGALLTASARFGVILGRASEGDYEKISKYAQKIGLAFQVKDDLLDAEGDVKAVGKVVGKDMDSKGFVALLGLAKTKKRLAVLITEAIEIAQSFDSTSLEKLAQFVGERDR